MAEERKLATVLFADLVGSTELGASQDPERTRVLLDRFYDAMTAEVEEAGGTIEKFAGDSVMAAFGAPAAHEDHAERALHAALSMQRRLRDLFGETLELRIGVNTGEVMVGRPREGSSFVTGDAVNVAARLEQGAEPGEILVGERTAAAVHGAFELGDPLVLDAKGKPEGVAAQRLIRALSLMRPRGVRGLRETFVGREAELVRLLAGYRRAAQGGRPRLVTLIGEAGVGKTRLLRELWRVLEDEDPAPLRRTGRCLSYGRGITYWPLGEVLKEHLGILESDSPERVRTRLGEQQILGLTLGLDVEADLHPLAARDRLHDAWITFVESLASERPLVLLVEDIHWAEGALLDLLERLARDVDAPLRLVATARPDFVDRRAGWGLGRIDSDTIWLEPLDKEDAGRLVDRLLAHELPEELRGRVIATAEGNPFFVEEVLASLIDRGLISRRGDEWELGHTPADLSIPDSVRAVLAARIDLLDAAEKDALQAAAVIGRVFWTGPVYDLLGGGEAHLVVLEDRDFIRRRSGSTLEGEPEFVFKHSLTREVAYAGLPKARRAHLHARFADWLDRFGEGRDEYASLLAHHYAEAVHPESADLAWAEAADERARVSTQACLWLQRAGDLAVRRYDLDGGLALLHRALELAPDKATKSTLWRAIGHANALKFDGEVFWTAMQNSLEVCTETETRAEIYADLAFQTAIRVGMWRRRPEQQLVDGWINRALELSESKSRARAKALTARGFWSLDGARSAAREASALAERLGDVELRSHAWRARAMTAFAEGAYAESLAWAQRRLETVPEISDPDHLADIYEDAVTMFAALGRLEDARRLTSAHREIVHPLTVHHRLHGISVILEVEEVCGTWQRITDLAPRTEAAVKANLATPCIRNARCLLLTALAEAYGGDTEGARHHEERGNEIVSEGWEAALAAPRARLMLLRGEIDRALELVPALDDSRLLPWFALSSRAARLDVLSAARDRKRLEQETPTLLRAGTYLEPFALRALGVVREERDLIEQALASFEAMGLDWYAAETRALL